ncbi:MAG TPA: sensor histidine kinase [Steroidobacteraceae bacterium]|jgi:signal transduction histidine kinase
MKGPKSQLNGLADHLQAVRSQILQGWQDAVARDPQLTTASTISRTQFNDHIPQVLDSFEHRLRARNTTEKRHARDEQRENAAEHGLHRWQQGYDQSETMREWGHLHVCVLTELDRYEREHPGLHAAVLSGARMALVQLCAEGVCESAARYGRLQQSEAASRANDLARALQDLRALERERAEVWREAAHDLRGTVSVISNASAILTRKAIPDPTLTRVSQLLRRNMVSLQELLGDLMDLARLEAGQERRKLAPFDAAQLLKEYCDSTRELATERNLFLKTEGPASLLVDGDAIKVRRIVQNLVLNALKVTKLGGVRVTWQEHEVPGTPQWVVCVQDTGPGFDPAHATPFLQVLKEATATAQDLEVSAVLAGDESADADPAPTLVSGTASSTSPPQTGEGIGLSIIKRLCELLDASLELQTSPGRGTTFRVTFPRHYQSFAQSFTDLGPTQNSAPTESTDRPHDIQKT